MNIIKIIIGSYSGGGFVHDSFSQELEITSTSISYEYNSGIASNPRLYGSHYGHSKVLEKWFYTTNDPRLIEIYNDVAEMTPHYLSHKEGFRTDSGSTYVRAIFEDQHEESAGFYEPQIFLADYFRTIQQLIPYGQSCHGLIYVREKSFSERLTGKLKGFFRKS